MLKLKEHYQLHSNPCCIFHYSDPNPALELFIFAEGGGSLIYELYGDDVLFQEYIYEGKTPFALDKRNRNAFFTIPVSGLYSIWKRNIDDLFMEEVGSGVLNVCCMYVYIFIELCMYMYVSYIENM